MLIESKASNDHMPTSQTNPPENQGNQTEIKPSQTEKPEPCTSRGDEALTKVGAGTLRARRHPPPPTSEDVTSDSQSKRATMAQTLPLLLGENLEPSETGEKEFVPRKWDEGCGATEAERERERVNAAWMRAS